MRVSVTDVPGKSENIEILLVLVFSLDLLKTSNTYSIVNVIF